MFIYSVRASTLRTAAVIVLVLVLLISALSIGNADTVYASGSGEINYSGMKTNEDRVKFIEGFGIMVKDEPTEEESFNMPENFDRVILGYNELQKKQGLDLSKYAKKKVTRYTYEVENWKDGIPVYVNLLVYRSKIIACDISSSSGDGFVLPLCDIGTEMLKSKEE
ncbi:MAG: DUF4830 domain-containing protein [Clostridia bacterium]|nr:DUF4830 domain-containing protein [Clostridia bacterium]